MRVIYVDSDREAVDAFDNYIDEYQKDKVKTRNYFSTAVEAIYFVKENIVDIAIMETELPDMMGALLATHLRRFQPEIVIVYLTSNSKRTAQAYKSGGIAYIMKPFTNTEMNSLFSFLNKIYLPSPEIEKTEDKKDIFIQTFGRFELLIDGIPVVTKNAKAKELFALLVNCRGVALNNAEIFSYLWEDKEYNNSTATYVRRAIKSLKDILEEIGCSDLVCFNRNNTYINRTMFWNGIFDCDYYKTVNDSDEYVGTYNGEYMSQYAWGEDTIPLIERKIKALGKK